MSVVTLNQLHEKAKQETVTHGFDIGRVRYEIEEITPDRAEQLLGKVRKGGARDQKAINTYSDTIRAGAWIFNGVPIVIGEDGAVLDGVQRLAAVVQADTSITTLVAYGVRNDTMHTLDQHRRRSYVGVLESRGERNPGPLMRLTAKMIRIENGILGVQDLQIGWTRFDRVIDSNPLLREAVQISTEASDAALRATARHALIYMALAAGHRKTLHRFLLALRRPDEFPSDEPAVILATQLNIARQQDTPFDTDSSLAMACMAFNDTLSGERRKAYIWKPKKASSKRGGGTKTGQLALEHKGSSRQLSSMTAPNRGLPLVTGYEGLTDAQFKNRRAGVLEGPLVQTLRDQHEREVAGDAAPYEIEEATVTPDMATDWLARYNTGNRNIQESHVRMIARDIASGNWMFNAQPICFSTTGRLLNGQHRLRGVVEADQPIEVLIVRNVADEAFTTYDVHAKKSVPAGMGGDDRRVDERVMLAAAKILWRVENDIAARATDIKPSASELNDIVRRHPGLAEAFPRGRRMDSIASAAVMTFIVYHTTAERSEYAPDFLDGLETGENLTKDNPLLKTRNQLLQIRAAEYDRRNAIEMLLDCWKAYCAWRDKTAED